MHTFPVFLIFLLLISLQSVVQADSLPLSDLDILREAVGAESASLLPLVSRLRFFALILLGIALTISSILAATGRTSPALGTGMGALILFGGIWILSLFWQTFGNPTERIEGRSGEYAELQTEEGLSGTDRFLCKLGRECVSILSKTMTPFILIEGIWLAIALPSGGWKDPICTHFLIGSLIAFSAVVVGRLFFFVF